MRVVYLAQTLRSLEYLRDYLLEDQNASLQTVERILGAILDKAESLSHNPYIGQQEDYLLTRWK